MNIDWSAVRSIPPKTKGNRGWFPSSKVPEGIVEYESQIERDLFLQLEHAPDVKRFQHQPITIPYKDEKGEDKSYTPDVFIEFNNKECVLVEVKDQETILEKYEKFRTRWNAAEEWAKQKGYIFITLTEKEIRNARMANIWFTLGSSKCTNNDKYMNKLNSLIPLDGETYNSLCIKLAEELGVEVGKINFEL